MKEYVNSIENIIESIANESANSLENIENRKKQQQKPNERNRAEQNKLKIQLKRYPLYYFMDMLKNKFPESVANKILLFVSSQAADIMKQAIEAINNEFEDVIGFVLEEGFKIDDSFSCLFFMHAKLKKERKRDAKYHRQVIGYEMNKKWTELIRKFI